MPAQPDSCWEHIAGGITPAGLVIPMSFEVLEGLAAEWVELAADVDPKSGPGALLRMSRSLFTHAWFDYEFMTVEGSPWIDEIASANDVLEIRRDLSWRSRLRHVAVLTKDAVFEALVFSVTVSVLTERPKMSALFGQVIRGGNS